MRGVEVEHELAGAGHLCAVTRLKVQAGNLAVALWHPAAPTQRLLPARLPP